MNKFFLDLGRQPLANSFLTKFSPKQTKYNLKLYFNTKTKIVSISKRIPSSVMFNSKYPYRSSMSITMRTSFKKLSDEIQKEYEEDHSYGDELFPFQSEKEENDNNTSTYSTGTMDKFLMS